MLRRSVNDAHEERPGVHIQAVYGLTVRAVWQFMHNVRTNRVCSVYNMRLGPPVNGAHVIIRRNVI